MALIRNTGDEPVTVPGLGLHTLAPHGIAEVDDELLTDQDGKPIDLGASLTLEHDEDHEDQDELEQNDQDPAQEPDPLEDPAAKAAHKTTTTRTPRKKASSAH